VLAAKGVFGAEELRRTVLLGELGLDGRVRPVRGVLPATLAAQQAGFTRVIGLPLDYDELERWTRVGFERGAYADSFGRAEVVLETTGGGHCRRTDASNPNPSLSMPPLP
jgi:predicted ATPase with chaperone activity